MPLLTCAFAAALLLGSGADSGEGPTLVGFAWLPPDTFEPGGHKSGQFLGGKQVNGRRPPFDSQPIQGISAVVAGDEPGTFLALSDNGYGAIANSADYILTVYRVKPQFKTEQGGTGKVEIEVAFRLSDPDKHIKWPIVADRETYPNSDIPVPTEIREGRLLTGADLDVESMVRLPDGTFWIGDEFGPFLLHFDKDGKLLEPPVELPGEGMHSPDHPTKDPATAKVQRSGGFEGMTTNGVTPLGSAAVWVLLEKPIPDVQTLEYRGIGTGSRDPFQGKDVPHQFVVTGHFPIAPDADAIGDWTTVGPPDAGPLRATLVIERDNRDGRAAMVKRLVFFRPDNAFGDTQLRKVVADLLNLPDPHDLNGDGQRTFRFPFVTIESVLPVDERTVLVINDNNYPSSSGRTPGQPDPTEFILIRFPKPLAELGNK